jgi:hypothetical protein
MIEEEESMNPQDKTKNRDRIESELLRAIRSKELVVTPEELRGRTLVAVLREKLEPARKD